MSIPRCTTCRGPVLSGSCLHCGRSPEPERVSMSEALLSNATPLDAVGDSSGREQFGPRQPIPLAVSLERARRWSAGECAP